MKYFYLILFSLIANNLWAQAPMNINGKVLDIETNQPIADACVILESKDNIYSKTKADGSFSIELKGKKTGDAAMVITVLKGYKMVYSAYNNNILLAEKGIDNMVIFMQKTSLFYGTGAAFALFDKMIERKEAKMMQEVASFKPSDERIVEYLDSLSIYKQLSSKKNLYLTDYFTIINELQTRKLNETGLRAKKVWQGGDLQETIRILEEGKPLENWQKAPKTNVPQSNASYNEALWLSICYKLDENNPRNGSDLQQKILMKDTTNSEIAYFHGSSLLIENDIENGVKYLKMASRHCDSYLQNALVNLILALRSAGEDVKKRDTKKQKSDKNPFAYVESLVKNCKKGDAAATKIYQQQMVAIIGLLSMISQNPTHLKNMADMAAELNTDIEPCSLESYTFETLKLMSFFSEESEIKALQHLKNIDDNWAQCYKQHPTMQIGHLYSGILGMEVIFSSVKQGYREGEILYKKQSELYRNLLKNSKVMYLNKILDSDIALIEFAKTKEQTSLTKQAIDQTLQDYRIGMDYDALEYESSLNDFITENLSYTDEDSTLIRLLQREIAYYEPLAAKKPLLYAGVCSRLYGLCATQFNQDSTKKSEILVLYDKNIKLMDKSVLVSSHKFINLQQNAYDDFAYYQILHDNYTQAEDLRKQQVTQVKTLYDSDKSAFVANYFSATSCLIDFYNERLYEKDNPIYRKTAKQQIVIAERLIGEKQIAAKNKLKNSKLAKEVQAVKDIIGEDATNDSISIKTYKDFFENVSAEDALLIGRFNRLFAETDTLDHVKNTQIFIEKYREKIALAKTLNQHLTIKNSYDYAEAAGHGELAWELIFAGKYAEAESEAKNALGFKFKNNDPKEIEWANGNLAAAYLLQGKYSDAQKIYKKFKGKMYSEDEEDARSWNSVFRGDLNSLEEAGITHKDFEKVRKMFPKDDE